MPEAELVRKWYGRRTINPDFRKTLLPIRYVTNLQSKVSEKKRSQWNNGPRSLHWDSPWMCDPEQDCLCTGGRHVLSRDLIWGYEVRGDSRDRSVLGDVDILSWQNGDMLLSTVGIQSIYSQFPLFFVNVVKVQSILNGAARVIILQVSQIISLL